MPIDELLLTVEDGIATLTLNRPEKLNAMSTAMWSGLGEVVEAVRTNEEVKVLVLTGAGRGFCAGSDVVGRLAENASGARYANRREMIEPVGYPTVLLERLSVPVVGAINGVATGAGLSLAMLCDIRLASDRARFGASWTKVGLVPDCGATYLLPRIVGLDRALELIFTGEFIDAATAERIGLVTRVVPHDDLPGAALELATKIARGPAVALQTAKRLARQGLHNTFEQQLDLETRGIMLCRSTQDHLEGVRAFQERRSPVFRGL